MANKPDFKAMNLYQRMWYIQDEMQYLQKTGYNSFHKYNYTTEEDLLNKVKPLLKEARVLFVFGITGAVDTPDNITRVTAEGKFINIDNPEEVITVLGIGEGADFNSKGTRGDKGGYKATTGAHKYLIMKAFHCATGDDPEVDVTTPEPPKPKDKVAPSVDEFHKKVSAMTTVAALDKAATWLNDNKPLYKDTDIDYLTSAIKNRRAVVESDDNFKELKL